MFSAGLARHRLGPRRGAAALAASGLSVLGEAGLLASAFEVAGAPVPWPRTHAQRPWSAPGRPARPGLKPARAHPRPCPASGTPQAAAGHVASARSPPDPG